MSDLVEKFTHPSFVNLGGTLAGYTIILVVMFVLLFVIPYLIFALL